jgi:hypothetical protein
MRDSLVAAEFASLGLDDYFADFWQRFERLDGVLWKLERRQDFREPGYPSWDAFASGRIRESLTLADESRAELEDYHHKLTARGVASRRVRVVANPPTPYLWWESHILKIRADAGEQIRTVGIASVAGDENECWTLPELVILGSATMYEVQYNLEGVVTGAHRYDQLPLIEYWTGYIARLFETGEPFGAYYRREVESRTATYLPRE